MARRGGQSQVSVFASELGRRPAGAIFLNLAAAYFRHKADSICKRKMLKNSRIYLTHRGGGNKRVGSGYNLRLILFSMHEHMPRDWQSPV